MARRRRLPQLSGGCHSAGVLGVGSRTKTTGVWLLPDDETLFAGLLLEMFPAAVWRCGPPGPAGLHPVHLHATVVSAMTCGGGVQAFLDLPIGGSIPDAVAMADGLNPPGGPPAVALVQLLRSRTITLEGVTMFRMGRLATSWSEPEVGPLLHAFLTDQRRLIWSALTRTTRPAHLSVPAGKPVTGHRIGPGAFDEVIRTGLPLTEIGRRQLRLHAGKQPLSYVAAMPGWS
jgi:hypothetical protein